MTEAQELGVALLTSLMATLNINSPFQESTFNVLTRTDSNFLFSENFVKSLWTPASEEVHFWLWFHLLLKPHLLLLPTTSWHLLNLLWRSFALHFHPPWRPSLFWQSCLDLLKSLSNNNWMAFSVRKGYLQWIGILWERKRFVKPGD